MKYTTLFECFRQGAQRILIAVLCGTLQLFLDYAVGGADGQTFEAGRQESAAGPVPRAGTMRMSNPLSLQPHCRKRHAATIKDCPETAAAG